MITLETLLKVKKNYRRGLCSLNEYKMHIKAYTDKCNLLIIGNKAIFIKNSKVIEIIEF